MCEEYSVGVRIGGIWSIFEDRQILKEEDYPTAGRYILSHVRSARDPGLIRGLPAGWPEGQRPGGKHV